MDDIKYNPENNVAQNDFAKVKNDIRNHYSQENINKYIIELSHIYLSGNIITEIPIELCQLTQLQHIDLSHNNINKIPKEIFNNPKKGFNSPISIWLINNEKFVGGTWHYIDKGIDTGNIIKIVKTPSKHFNAFSLNHKIFSLINQYYGFYPF